MTCNATECKIKCQNVKSGEWPDLADPGESLYSHPAHRGATKEMP